MNAGVAVNVW